MEVTKLHTKEPDACVHGIMGFRKRSDRLPVSLFCHVVVAYLHDLEREDVIIKPADSLGVVDAHCTINDARPLFPRLPHETSRAIRLSSRHHDIS